MKHTPGPWSVDDHLSRLHHRYEDGHRDIVSESSGSAIASTTHGWDHNEEPEANARLIAAAPDMLAELQRMEQRMVRLIDSGDCGHWESDKDEDVISMRKIIAKATGTP